MLRSVKLASLALAAIGLSTSAALSSPLVDTGFVTGGATPGTPGNFEGNWTVTASCVTGCTGDTLPLWIVTGAGDYPGAWVNPASKGLDAQWISPWTGTSEPVQGPNHSLALDDPNSHTQFVDYTYTLTGVAKPAGNVLLQWATDNGGQLFVDGSAALDTISAPSVGDKPFADLTKYTIAQSAFTDPLNNTITFVVRNLQFSGPNPTGLLAEFTVQAVPLPPALLLFGSALAGLNWLRRRRPDSRAAFAIG